MFFCLFLLEFFSSGFLAAFELVLLSSGKGSLQTADCLVLKTNPGKEISW